MAKSESNIPDDVKTTPENEQTAPVAEATVPEMNTEEAATLAHEGEAALHNIGDDGPEPPTPFDTPASGDVVVPFDKFRGEYRIFTYPEPENSIRGMLKQYQQMIDTAPLSVKDRPAPAIEER